MIKVNNRKVLDGVMEAIGLGGAENAGRRLTVLRAIDKLDRLGPEGVRALLGEGRKDESGDFTRGAGLRPSADVSIVGRIAPIRQELGPTTNASDSRRDWASGRIANTASRLRPASPTLSGRRLAALALACRIWRRTGSSVDPSVVRGLEYYTGPVFEAELNFEVKDEAGRPVRFGSVGGGGRYDGLVARFRSEPVPATGFSIGVSRLLAALRAINSPIVAEAVQPGPVVVLVLDRDRIADYQRLVAVLRGAGIASELYLGAAGMNAQLKYADRRRSLCAVIQGSNERDAPGGPQVVVRDLALGAELAKASKDRSDYLEMRQRAQIAAPEAELVTRVREVLARGGAPLLAP